jgi:segregation and condensation protein A
MQTYKIKIQKFEGPFDLLLFFIERDELDIYDIPIAKITKDFLDYIKNLEALDIDVASEFILVAATLMSIKAKMMLPRKELDEHGNEIDPRAELTERLLEYKKYKSVVDEFMGLEELRSLRFKRGNPLMEYKQVIDQVTYESELENISLYKLMQVFSRLMKNYDADKKKVVHRIYNYDYSIEGQQNFIKNMILQEKRVNFIKIFEQLENRIHAVVTFIGLLELLNLQQVKVIQGEGVNNFWIEPGSFGEEE